MNDYIIQQLPSGLFVATDISGLWLFDVTVQELEARQTEELRRRAGFRRLMGAIFATVDRDGGVKQKPRRKRKVCKGPQVEGAGRTAPPSWWPEEWS